MTLFRPRALLYLILIASLLLSLVIPPSTASATSNIDLSNSKLEPSFNIKDSPRLLQGKLSTEINSETELINYLSGNQKKFSITQAKNTLQIINQNTDNQGKQHFMLQQHYHGIPVYGHYLTAHLGTDNIIYAITNDTSSTIDRLTLDTTPFLDGQTALRSLISSIEQDNHYSINLDDSNTNATDLLLYLDNGQYVLAYRIELSYRDPVEARWVGFINANTGQIIKKFNRIINATQSENVTFESRGYYGDTRTIQVTKETDNNYYLIDKTKPMYRTVNGVEQGTIETYDASNPFYPVNSNSSNFMDPDAVDAHYFVGQVYDFYAEYFDYNSFDNNGKSIISVVNAGPIDNSYWNGSNLVFGDGHETFRCLACASDIVAHEYTHGVIEHIANLEYVGESGALNESIADIMAVVFDQANWVIGEYAGVASTYGVLRDLANPERGLTPQPAHMSGYVKLPENQDNGGVHINSGIPNHAAYLIATGIDKLPGLEGQGRDLLGQLVFRALTSYLTPTSGFEAARDALVLAASDLVLEEIQQHNIISVIKDAWATIGLPYTNNENDIVSFSAYGMVGTADINTLAHTVTFQVAYGTDLATIVPEIKVSPGATLSINTDTAPNFSNPVAYTVTSSNGQAQVWLIQGSVLNPAGEHDITDFYEDILTGDAIIDSITHRVTIYVEANDNVSSLKPTITVSEGASISPASGATVNLSRPVTYTVTAENGTSQKWTLSAIKDSKSPKLLGAVALRENVIGVVFDKTMNLSNLANISNYKLESMISSYSDPSIIKVEIDCEASNIVYITTSTLASLNGYKLTVSNLKGTTGNNVRPDSTIAYLLTEDTLPPVLSTARLNGKTIELTFSEPLSNVYGAIKDTFHVFVNNTPVTIKDMSSITRRVTLTLEQSVPADAKVELSYKHYTHIAKVKDLSGNELAPFDKVPVIKQTNPNSVVAGEDWAHFNGDIKQMIKHPTEPIVYSIFNQSNQVVSVNLDTGNVNTETLDRVTERLYVANDKLYVALVDRPHSYYWWTNDQTGSIAILDAISLEKENQFTIALDPFDIVVSESGIIFVTSGSGQWTEIQSYSPTNFSRISSSIISDRSYMQYRSGKIYTTSTTMSPRNLYVYTFNESGEFTSTTNDYNSPYHGDYPLADFNQISPDYNYMFNGSGHIFTASTIKEQDLYHAHAIKPFNSIVFDLDNDLFYTLQASTLRVYKYSDFSLIREITVSTNAKSIMPSEKPGELLISYSINGGTTLQTYEIPTLNTSNELNSIAAAASYNYSPINACPIKPPSDGGGSLPPIGGGDGGGFPPIGGGDGGIIIVPPFEDVVTPVPTNNQSTESSKPSVTLPADSMKRTSHTDSAGNVRYTYTLDPDKLWSAFTDLNQKANTSNQLEPPTIIVPIGKLEHGSSTVEIPANFLTRAKLIAPNAILIIQADSISYQLPIKAFSEASLLNGLSSSVNIDALKLSISIEKTDEKTTQTMNKTLTSEGYKALSAAYNFTIHVGTKDNLIELNEFNSIYLTRSFQLTTATSARQITALRYDPTTGLSHFVPASIRKEGNLTIVDVKTQHNSIYTIASSAKTFTDITNHWAKQDIELMASKKVVLGVTDTKFEPNRTITRAEFASLLVRALGLPTTSSKDVSFTDVQTNAWYATSASVASQAGLIKGEPNGRYNPNGMITRQEMAVMLSRAIQFVQKSEVAITNSPNSVAYKVALDRESIPQWSKLSIDAMLRRGIMDNNADGLFNPSNPVTRAEAVVSLKRMIVQLEFISE